MIEQIELVMTWVIGGLLGISALLTLIRVTIGPSVLDRVVATDVLVSIAVCAVGAHIALNPGVTSLPLLISFSLIGFMGAVAVARFVARDRDYPVQFDDDATTIPPEAEGAVEESTEQATRRASERQGRAAEPGAAMTTGPTTEHAVAQEAEREAQQAREQEGGPER